MVIENQQPFYRRFYQYQKERFPFLVNSTYLLAFAFSAISYARICRGVEGFVDAHLFWVAGITTILFFWLLRLTDEFKDKEYDAQYRPYLAVPRGLISYKELRWMIAVSLILQVIINALFTPRMLLLYLLPAGFLFFMSNDFFLKKVLQKNWLVYMVVHMFFFPFIDTYSSGMDWFLDPQGKAPLGLLFFFGVSYTNGIVYEIGRKIRVPENEEHNTYSRMFGAQKATFYWLIALSIAYLISIVASWFAGYGFWGIVFLSFIFIVSAIPALIFLQKKTIFYSKWIELSSGGWGLMMYLTLGAFPMLKNLLF